MPVNINLLKNRHTLSEADYQKERNYYKYSIVSMVVVVAVTLGVSIWQFVLTRQLNGIEEKITNSSKNLQNLSEASAMQIYLKSRLKLITAFLDEREVSRQALQRVFSVEIPGVIISGASFESDNVLKVQATATDALSLSQFVDYVSKGDEFFVQIISEGISRTQSGEYQMNLLLTIPKG